MECAHGACVCNVTSDEYCSDHCRTQAASGHSGEGCQCGHPECEMRQQR